MTFRNQSLEMFLEHFIQRAMMQAECLHINPNSTSASVSAKFLVAAITDLEDYIEFNLFLCAENVKVLNVRFLMT